MVSYTTQIHLTVLDVMKGNRICLPQICYFGILIILSCRHLQNSKGRERLFSDLPLSAYGQNLQKELNCYKFPSPGVSLAGEETSG